MLNEILSNNFTTVTNGLDDECKSIKNNLSTIEKKIEKARDLFLEDKLDEEDFRSIKNKCKG